MLYTNIRLDWKTIEYFRNINIKNEEKQALENSSISKVRPNHSWIIPRITLHSPHSPHTNGLVALVSADCRCWDVSSSRADRSE